MKNLQLSLKRNWFEMTKAGIKTEDYREITPFWCNRLLLYRGIKRSREFWEGRLQFFKGNTTISGNVTTCDFDQNIMTDGYPKMNDFERILKLEHEGIEIGTGNPEWGAEQGKLYFVIKHGNIIL